MPSPAPCDKACKERGTLLFFIQIFVGNIILRHLVSVDFLLVAAVGGLDARHNFSFERVSFLDQFVHTLRICACGVRQSLQISRLPSRPRSPFFACTGLDIRTLAFTLNPPPGSARRLSARCLLADSPRFHGWLLYSELPLRLRRGLLLR